MLVVSTREFRQNQRSYLNKIDDGCDILLQRKNRCYRISAVKEDDALMSKEEFFAKIDRSLEQARQGKTRILSKEEQASFLGLE
jgi:PHD/YefM family antitoxin component YafN of YafNO toxin-antitoxin module